MVHSESLILTVKKYKAIWDSEDESYHYKNSKEEAWNGVCLDLYYDWQTLTEGEKYTRQSELKKKLNNIRDYYKKLLSEQRSGEERKRRYLYSNLLEFMRPVYDKKRPETVINALNCSNDDSNISVSIENTDSDEQAHDFANDAQEMETITFIGIPSGNPSRRSVYSPQPEIRQLFGGVSSDTISSRTCVSSPTPATRQHLRRNIRPTFIRNPSKRSVPSPQPEIKPSFAGVSSDINSVSSPTTVRRKNYILSSDSR